MITAFIEIEANICIIETHKAELMSKTFKKADVITLSIAHLMHDTYSAFLAPLLPLLIIKLNMSLSIISFLDIIRRIPSLLNPLIGLLSERAGVKYFVILTPAVTAVSMSLIGLSNSVLMLFLLLFTSGLSAAFFHVPSPVIVKEAAGDRVGTGMSYYMVGGELARTLGPLLVTGAVSWWCLEETYKLIPLGLVCSLVLLFKLKNLDVHREKKRREKKGNPRELLREHGALLATIGGFTLFQTGMKSSLTLFLPVYLTNQGASLWLAGISLSVLQFFGVLGAFLSGNISDRIGRRTTLLIASSGSIIAMALFILTQNTILLAVLGFFILSTTPVLMASVQDTNSSMPAFMNSMYMTVNFGVSSIIVFCVGFLGDRIGLEKTYMVSCIFAVGSIPMAFLLPPTGEKVSK